MQELNEEQMEETSGGAWQSQQQIDFRNFNKTGYYFYPSASVTVKAGKIVLKPAGTREKISSAWGLKKVKIGTAHYTYKDSKGKEHNMIHVDFNGKKGYINAHFTKYIVNNSNEWKRKK